MTNSEEITLNLYNKYIVPNYGRFPIMPVKGDGSFLYDEDNFLWTVCFANSLP